MLSVYNGWVHYGRVVGTSALGCPQQLGTQGLDQEESDPFDWANQQQLVISKCSCRHVG